MRKLISRLGLLLLGIVFVFLLLEAAIRIYYVFHPTRVLLDPQVGWRHLETVTS